jgi:hypothetical protein
VIVSLIANLAVLGGLVLLDWSVWMAVAVYWLENVITLPALAIRIRRAFPHQTDAELGAYLAGRDSESSGGVSEGHRLRGVIAQRGRAGAAQFAASRFLSFYGAFALAHGLFVFVLGFFSSAFTGDQPDPTPDLAVFDWRALAVAGLLIGAAEALDLWLDRRPIMPDVDAYTRRMIVLHVTIIVGALLLTVLGSVALAVFFVALKTIADLGAGGRARRALARPGRAA